MFCSLLHMYALTGVARASQETDKATIDVEAQDDGILAKIIVRLCTFYVFACILNPRLR